MLGRMMNGEATERASGTRRMIGLTLPPHLLEEVEKLARTENRSLSNAARVLVEAGLSVRKAAARRRRAA